ncbi:hypothetical protein OIE66_13725 [Nonomuraea sp. NBC_01738]|uniref:hypothetical protein n=1 Tax=Nonomuraea sp. NBC_01738 TaxID=2976003 RepID=UPI002E0D2D8E|nr:hypothetical protein OIE66_13725 [Nonomuraea sp. NBC_01738]
MRESVPVEAGASGLVWGAFVSAVVGAPAGIAVGALIPVGVGLAVTALASVGLGVVVGLAVDVFAAAEALAGVCGWGAVEGAVRVSASFGVGRMAGDGGVSVTRFNPSRISRYRARTSQVRVPATITGRLAKRWTSSSSRCPSPTRAFITRPLDAPRSTAAKVLNETSHIRV